MKNNVQTFQHANILYSALNTIHMNIMNFMKWIMKMSKNSSSPQDKDLKLLQTDNIRHAWTVQRSSAMKTSKVNISSQRPYNKETIPLCELNNVHKSS